MSIFGVPFHLVEEVLDAVKNQQVENEMLEKAKVGYRYSVVVYKFDSNQELAYTPLCTTTIGEVSDSNLLNVVSEVFQKGLMVAKRGGEESIVFDIMDLTNGEVSRKMYDTLNGQIYDIDVISDTKDCGESQCDEYTQCEEYAPVASVSTTEGQHITFYTEDSFKAYLSK